MTRDQLREMADKILDRQCDDCPLFGTCRRCAISNARIAGYAQAVREICEWLEKQSNLDTVLYNVGPKWAKEIRAKFGGQQS